MHLCCVRYRIMLRSLSAYRCEDCCLTLLMVRAMSLNELRCAAQGAAQERPAVQDEMNQKLQELAAMPANKVCLDCSSSVLNPHYD